MAHFVVKVCDNLVESIITRNSAEELALKKGDAVKVVVKSTEVMIQRADRKRGRRPGPKGPAQEWIDAVLEMKRRNPTWVVRELPSQSLWLSAWISTSTECAGFWENSTGQNPDPVLVGTVRGECLDRTLFWTTADLEVKLREFQEYFNRHRTHAGLEGRLPDSGGPAPPISFASYGWQKHCRGLYQTPIAA